MGITIKGNILFEVKLMHLFYLNKGTARFYAMSEEDQVAQLKHYNVHDFFEIIPSTTTSSFLKGHKASFVKTNTGFLIGTQLDSENVKKPFVAYQPTDVMQFFVYFKDPANMNYTSKPVQSEAQKTYFFQNLNKTASDYPLLSNRVEVKEVAKTYASGSMVRNSIASTTVFEAKINTSSDTNVPTEWFQLPDTPRGYVNGQDQYALNNSQFEFVFSQTGKTGIATISKLDQPATGIKLQDTLDSDEVLNQKITIKNLETEQVVITPLATGRYEAKLLDQDDDSEIQKETFVSIQDSKLAPPSAIIEISMDRGASNYQVFKTNGEIKEESYPAFELRFNNRATFWRYQFKSNQTVDVGDDVKIENGSAKILITKDVKPLTKFGVIDINHSGNKLPNPNEKMIIPQDGKVISETYI